MVLNEGRPRIINEIVPLAKAVVHIMLPGNYGLTHLQTYWQVMRISAVNCRSLILV